MFPLPSTTNSTKAVMGMIRMSHVMKVCLPAMFSIVTLVSAASADELFKLSNNQRIACSRGLAAGKLNTATCKSNT